VRSARLLFTERDSAERSGGGPVNGKDHAELPAAPAARWILPMNVQCPLNYGEHGVSGDHRQGARLGDACQARRPLSDDSGHKGGVRLSTSTPVNLSIRLTKQNAGELRSFAKPVGRIRKRRKELLGRHIHDRPV